jgi:Cas6b C-terminal domain/Cas6b N-terminal domain
MTKNIPVIHISFPEVRLAERDAHKLRGYFGNLFQSYSPLLHNHLEGGGLRYDYPLVQYKVLNHIPTLVGLGEGAELLSELFLEIKELQIDEKVYPVYSKDIQAIREDIGYSDDLHSYDFQTLWMALNQSNYPKYRNGTPKEQSDQLNSILKGNILSFLSGMDIRLQPEQRIFSKLEVQIPKNLSYKDTSMMGFKGKFIVNIVLPNGIGLGKSVSRGYGVIRKTRTGFAFP